VPSSLGATTFDTDIYLGKRQGLRNTYLGLDAGLDTQSAATSNIGIGYEGLKRITTGGSNIGIGYRATVHTTTSSNNIGIGTDALGLNVSGSNNVGIGVGAGYQLTTDNNTAIGSSALFNATSGNGNNTAIGKYASILNTTGAYNTSLGVESAYSNQAGSSNVSIGYQAGYNSTASSVLYIGNASSGVGSKQITGNFATGQVGVNIDPGSINPAAILQVNSNSMGVLLPRGTTAQKNAITNPPEGLEFYDTTLHKKCVFTGSVWEVITSG